MTEPDVGSAAQEAMRLLRALGESSAAAPADDSAASSHACSTSWCPVCQVADFVRENPEVIAGVAASAGSMLVALRDLIDAAASSPARPNSQDQT
ncbi:MAG: hypothetical protein WB508_02205 [Aeromicrobium sp.]|uniref:hypothetical protein n=1 Tax=Aeromicrobium sp. TaxID=1871063 RepID=UPI003C405E86